jgi:hypothetical protein
VTAVIPAVPGMLHDQTRAWADRHAADVAWLDPDDEAYWRLLHAEWAVPGDLLLVEHDMLPAPGVTGAMTACPRPWCSSPYQIANGHWLADGLGCVKLAARLKTRHPDLTARLGAMDGDGLPARNWRRLDTRLSALLRSLGYRPHAHRRSLHLHDYARRP